MRNVMGLLGRLIRILLEGEVGESEEAHTVDIYLEAFVVHHGPRADLLARRYRVGTLQGKPHLRRGSLRLVDDKSGRLSFLHVRSLVAAGEATVAHWAESEDPISHHL